MNNLNKMNDAQNISTTLSWKTGPEKISHYHYQNIQLTLYLIHNKDEEKLINREGRGRSITVLRTATNLRLLRTHQAV